MLIEQKRPEGLVGMLLKEQSSVRAYNYKFKQSNTGSLVMGLTTAEKLQFWRDLIHWLPKTYNLKQGDDLARVDSALSYLVTQKLPFEETDYLEMVGKIGRRGYARPYFEKVTRLIETKSKHGSISPELRKKIEQAIRRAKGHIVRIGYLSEPHQVYIDRMKVAAGLAWAKLAIVEGEGWSIHVITDINTNRINAFDDWSTLFRHCSIATASTPSKKWLKEAGQYVEPIGWPAFYAALLDWLPKYKEEDFSDQEQLTFYERVRGEIGAQNARVLRGLIWLSAIQAPPELPELLRDVAQAAYRKIPGTGPRSTLIGNGAIWALSEIGTDEAISKLSILKMKLKPKPAQKAIQKGLERAAKRSGLTQREMAELSVATYGLTKIGQRIEQLGDFQAKLSIDGSQVNLVWIKPDGKIQKSVPKAVKEEHAAELNALKQAIKDIKAVLPAHKRRIESAYTHRWSWPLADWLKRYHNHRLIGTIARRLIWGFETNGVTTTAMWDGETFTNAEGHEIDTKVGETIVTLWHPLDANDNIEQIEAWRTRLEDHHIQQPFKQAHREIYLLTAAEENTGTYSNRFAAHILRQHQFHALCQARGWHNKLRLLVDDYFPPASVDLPAWGIRAEFWINEIGDDNNGNFVYDHLSTDQVRFYAIEIPEDSRDQFGGHAALQTASRPDTGQLPVREVPALPFSEIMRDVDLFVGVASVGNDPTWGDRGPGALYQNYWNNFSFGALSISAENRKKMLERIVPRLKIGEQCHFEGRFLMVQGSYRLYKIHLGSGNILMAPNDQYLCIVPDNFGGKSKQANQVYLPFEGDRTTAIILSKALLLADDKRIQDNTILSQIRRR